MTSFHFFGCRRPDFVNASPVTVLYIIGDSVVAGLVPATSPWKDLLPTPTRVPHADNADLADDSLCEISEISVSKKM